MIKKIWRGVRKSQLRRQDGQALVFVMLTLGLLFVIAVVVVDGSIAFAQRRAAQNGADAVALAAAQSLASDGTCDASCQAIVEKYRLANNVPSSLVSCDVSHTTNCYVAPYNGTIGKIEVRLTKLNVPTFFGGVVAGLFHSSGISSFNASARAVGAVDYGAPPEITFAALNSNVGCDAHTLVIRSSGHLIVNNNIYVDTCNGLAAGSTKGDGFDVFGTGGSISAKDIFVHGGWETHDGDAVIIPVGGTTCSLLSATASTPSHPGCPKVGQPLLVDPFSELQPPSLDSVGITSSCTPAAPCYALAPYSPSQILDGGIADAAQTALTAFGTAIANGTWISIDGERMKVTGLPGGSPAGERKLTVTRGQLFTTAAAHTLPAAISIAFEQRVGNVATLTTSTPHGLEVGDWVKLSGLADATFNGIWQVTGIPDDETGGPKQFTFDNTGSDVGGVAVTGVSRTSGVSSVRTAANHGLSAGDPVVVNITTGDTSFDEGADDGVSVDSSPAPTSTTFAFDQPGFFFSEVHGTRVPIHQIGRFDNLTTINTSANHGVPDGDWAIITFPPDTSFNGMYSASVVDLNTITYQHAAPDYPASTLGSAQTVSKVARYQGVAWVTTATALSGLTVNTPTNRVDVNLAGADTSFNGTFDIASLTNGSKTFSYANPGADSPLGPNIAAKFAGRNSAGLVTLTTQTSHGIAVGDQVIVNLADATFNNNGDPVTVTQVSATTFQYQTTVLNQAVGNSTAASGNVNELSAAPPAGSTAARRIAAALKTVDGGGNVCTSPNPACTVSPAFVPETGDVAGHAVNVTAQSGTAQGRLFEIFHVTNPTTPVTTGSSRTAPVEYSVPAGTSWTLYPGTYYGGICIGAPDGAHCGPKVGGSCATSSAAPVTVTMNPGIYKMAGGGFYVCGNTTLDASAGVMIYNTVDSATLDAGANALAASLGQVEFNTNGNVKLSPIKTAPYGGMTIYQGPDPASTASPNPNLQLSTAKCDGRALNLTDIALVHTGNGLNGISGTIYAPGPYALFRDSVSGVATLAIITGCIFIDGANSTFNFDNSGGALFGQGLGFALAE